MSKALQACGHELEIICCCEPCDLWSSYFAIREKNTRESVQLLEKRGSNRLYPQEALRILEGWAL